jgi:hypothetical protein
LALHFSARRATTIRSLLRRTGHRASTASKRAQPGPSSCGAQAERVLA